MSTLYINNLSLHDALPIFFQEPHARIEERRIGVGEETPEFRRVHLTDRVAVDGGRADLHEISVRAEAEPILDRKSTRLNSSQANISYAYFCLKKKIKQLLT